MKEWLIRTKSNHILGPVSKEKLRELIANNSIKGDDEVCCGNGYWLFVREKELVTKYIFGEERQSFNPVQEAELVELDEFPPPAAIEPQMPVQTDLEYPSEDSKRDTTVDQISDVTDHPGVIKKKTIQKDLIKASGKKRIEEKPVKISKSKQSFYISPWIIIAVIFILLIVVSTIFKDRIMKTMVSGVLNNLDARVYAQTITSSKKKNGFNGQF
jgi:hypothetical protein